MITIFGGNFWLNELSLYFSGDERFGVWRI
jgi:hypothetical protein